jgi:hypothetical protein
MLPPAVPASSWQAPAQPVVQPPAQQPQSWQAAPPAAPQQPWQAPVAPPQQQWQQPPQQPQGWQQQQQGWQQQAPAYPPPPPGYAQAQQGWSAEPPYGSSAFAALAGLILVLFGLAVAAIGAWSFTQGPEIGRFIRDNDVGIFGTQIPRETLRAVLSPMPAVLIVVGILQLLSGAGVFAHKGWARALGLLLALLGLLVALFAVSLAVALAPGASIPVIISVVLLIGYALVVLALIAGGNHFRRRYPPAR